jgi:hypothetical protein
MRPTIEEQLDGVQRLLGLATADPALSCETAELLRNAQRLVARVAGSWATTLPFLVEDNVALAELLGPDAQSGETGVPGAAPSDVDPTDVAAVVARNEALRAALSRLVHDLPDCPAGRARRADIGRYLRRRIAADPT